MEKVQSKKWEDIYFMMGTMMNKLKGKFTTGRSWRSYNGNFHLFKIQIKGRYLASHWRVEWFVHFPVRPGSGPFQIWRLRYLKRMVFNPKTILGKKLRGKISGDGEGKIGDSGRGTLFLDFLKGFKPNWGTSINKFWKNGDLRWGAFFRW